MKKIEAIINLFRFDKVRQALERVGVEGLTVSEVKRFGREKGATEIYRGGVRVVDFVPRLKLETAVSDFKASQTVEAIKDAARTGCIGDGRVFVSSLDDAVRIRTGEHGNDAL